MSSNSNNVIQLFPRLEKKQGKNSSNSKQKKVKKSKESELLDDLKEIFDEAPREQPSSSTTINIDKSTGIQTGDNTTANYHFHQKKPPTLKTLPPPDSIGGQVMLKKAIKDRFDELAKRRAKRFGDTGKAFKIMYAEFKKDFKIKGKPLGEIWLWPSGTAKAIIAYLDNKLSNTIEGRIEGASSKENYLHTRRQLYKREKELLEHFDLELDSTEVREKLNLYFGTTSHTKLSHLQHWHWVSYLDEQVQNLELSD